MGHFLLRSNWIIAFLFWFGFGLSILIKGPVVPLICLLTVLCLTIWDKDAKWLWQLKPVFGIIIVTAMVYPWLNAINQSTGGAFLKDSIGKDLIPKLLGGVESHGAYFGYYTLLVTLTLWPCSMFMWPALWGIKRDREIPAIRFSIAWILPAWLLFELIPTKLPHYVLPLYPALTFATGVLLSTAWRTTEPLFLLKKARIWYVIWYVFSIILGVGIFLIPIKLGSGYNNFAVVGCGVMVISLALTINWRNKMLYFQASIASIVGAIAMFSVTYGALLPNLDVIWISKRVKNIVTQEEKPIASVGFHEPSLVFLNGTKTNLTTFDKAYKHFQKHPKSVILVARKHKKQFLSSMKKHNIKVEATNSVDGINYSRGDEIVLDFYKRKIENR
jgi:4-amino-4-deoxy-L-arabinose transferase-like glycosyltransferase